MRRRIARTIQPQRQLFTLILIIGLMIALFIAVRLAQQRQDIRNRAAGTGAITMSLSPASVLDKKAGDTVVFQVKLKNISGTAIYIAGADISYNSTYVDISGISCGTFGTIPLSDAKKSADTTTIHLSCFLPGGNTAYLIPIGTEVVLGTFTATVKSTAPAGGTTTLAFTRTLIPSSTGDLSDAGSAATIGIGASTSLCDCVSDVCNTSCEFAPKLSGANISYPASYRCAPNYFSTATTGDKKTLCGRSARTQGDADGLDGVNSADYDYYRRTVLGKPLPLPTIIPINADFNGDGEVGTTDLAIFKNKMGL